MICCITGNRRTLGRCFVTINYTPETTKEQSNGLTAENKSVIKTDSIIGSCGEGIDRVSVPTCSKSSLRLKFGSLRVLIVQYEKKND